MTANRRLTFKCQQASISSIYQPGATAETVIYIHDLGRESGDFLPLLPKLKLFENYLIDLVGFGESSKPESFDYSLQHLVDAIFESLNTTSSEMGYQIVGTGLGFVIGLLMAQSSPKAIRSVIGVGLGSLRSTKHNELMPISINEEIFARTEYPIWISAQKSRGENTKGLERAPAFSYFRTAQALRKFIDSGRLLEVLKEIKQPKYIIYGEKDKETLNYWSQFSQDIFSSKYIPLVIDNPIVENTEHSALVLETILSDNANFADLSK